jgi:hypothetical protein
VELLQVISFAVCVSVLSLLIVECCLVGTKFVVFNLVTGALGKFERS